MKYLIMCEGANEEKIINMLLDNNKLKITRDDLIGMRPYYVRQLNNPFMITSLRHYNKPVIVYRVGDTQNDELEIPGELENIVFKDKIFKFCTKPEIEMLLIINEKLLAKQRKSREKVKIFAKKNIKFNGKSYDQSTKFFEEYYGGKNIEKLVQNIIEYKRIKKHNKGELYLADLLK